MGQSDTIRWHTSGQCLKVNLYFSDDRGNHFELIAANLDNSGQYIWPINIDTTSVAQFKISRTDDDSVYALSAIFRIEFPSSSIEDGSETNTPTTKLYSNFPNPFNQTTQISFWSGVSKQLMLTVYNALGLIMWMEKYYPQVPQKIIIQLQTGNWPNGIYYYRLNNEKGQFQIKKMILLK